MSTRQMTTSVALYFSPADRWSVPMGWFEKARELFDDFNLSPILFSAMDGGFEIDGYYVLAERNRDVTYWDQVFAAREVDLLDALRNGAIRSLDLDSPRAKAKDRSDWRASVSVSSVFNDCYVGIDEPLIADPTALLHRALELSADLPNIRYGFAYTMPLAEDPGSYAIGSRATSFAEFRHWLQHRREWDQRQKTPDEIWADELGGARRHLTGLFRGAYPRNILSEAHLRTAGLESSGIGTLTKLHGSLWLWELTDSELPLAQELLESRDALVS